MAVMLSPSDTELIGQLIKTARNLTEPDDPNAEYIRGQAELIIDVMGLDPDTFKDDIINAIKGHRFQVETTVDI